MSKYTRQPMGFREKLAARRDVSQAQFTQTDEAFTQWADSEQVHSDKQKLEQEQVANAAKTVQEPWLERHFGLCWLTLFGFGVICCAIGFAIWFPLGVFVAICFGLGIAAAGGK
jgi:hypothetical protein